MAATESAAWEGAWKRSPIPAVAVGLMAGQLWAGTHGALAAPVALGAPLVIVLAACAPRLRRCAAALLAAVLGFHQAAWQLRPPSDPAHVVHQVSVPLRLRAHVVEDEVRLEHKTRVLIEAEEVRRGAKWEPARGLVLLSLAEPRRQWLAGARFEGDLLLRRPRNFGNPGELDYEGFLARRGVYATAFLFSDAPLLVLDDGTRERGWLGSARQAIAAAFARRLDSPAREVLGALILGTESALPRTLRDQFAAAGVSHVLSISGLHIAMVAGSALLAWWWLLGRSRWLLLRASVPKLAAALSLGPIAFYAGLAQGGVATARSVLMCGVFTVAVLCDRQRDLLVSLALAAGVVSVLWPGAVLDVSFQLSFVSVLALMLGMQHYWRWWRRYADLHLLHLRSRVWRWLGAAMGSLVVSVCALLATAPLTAFHFNQISLVGLIANPIVIPLLGTAAVGFGLVAAVAVLVWEPLARLPLALAGVSCSLGTRATVAIAAWPGAGVRVVTPSLVELALIYAALLALVALRGRRRQIAVAAAAMLIAVDAADAWMDRFHGGVLRLSFLSVGQGDSTLVEFPDGAVMVVDGGGLRGFDVGEAVVAPSLWRRRIRRIDYLVLTHPQFDHYGGLTALAREFQPREFWSSGATSSSPAYAELREALRAAQTRDVVVGAGDRRRVGQCEVRVLGPPRGPHAGNPNESSVVLRVQCGNASVVLPGDLEAGGEAEVLSQSRVLRSTVLKVGHHGSRTSSTWPFVAAVAPRLAVISDGYDNRFRFPSARVLDTYRRQGARVLRTDLDGAVLVTLSPTGDLAVSTGRVREPPPAAATALDPIGAAPGRRRE